eukprot:m.76830 g.76830  ORF g.76830 m.76830 type:complete len:476 (+) comp9090_c1_seq2:93-1520(+)
MTDAWAEMTQALEDGAFKLEQQSSLIHDLQVEVEDLKSQNEATNQLLEAMTARCDNMGPTIVALTEERNQLAKDKAALTKERDMLKKMMATRLTSVSREKPAPVVSKTPDEGAVIVAPQESHENSVLKAIPKEFKAAKAFFLGGEKFSAKYQADDDEEYEHMETVEHPEHVSTDVELDEDDDDTPPMIPDTSPPSSPAPPPPTTFLRESPEPTTTAAPSSGSYTPENHRAGSETPPVTTTTKRGSQARRGLFGGFASSLRKRFNNKDNSEAQNNNSAKHQAQQPRNSIAANPYFNDNEDDATGAEESNSQITFMTACEEDSVMTLSSIPFTTVTVPSDDGDVNNNNNTTTPSSTKKGSRSKKGGAAVPSKAKHDASVELRNQLKEAEDAVQMKTRALENARWVNTKVSSGATPDVARPSRGSSGYTKGMKVRKSKQIPEWKKAVDADIAAERERLKQQLAALAQKPPPMRRTKLI